MKVGQKIYWKTPDFRKGVPVVREGVIVKVYDDLATEGFVVQVTPKWFEKGYFRRGILTVSACEAFLSNKF